MAINTSHDTQNTVRWEGQIGDVLNNHLTSEPLEHSHLQEVTAKLKVFQLMLE